MDCVKTGELLRGLRLSCGLTQRQLGEKLMISDKAISKWENGRGCPDVSVLSSLGNVLGVDLEKLLDGKMEKNPDDNGNVRRMRFYVCPECGGIFTSAQKVQLFCCSRTLPELKAQKADCAHTPHTEIIENDYVLTFDHEMTKQHYIKFVCHVMSDRYYFVRLYPEQEPLVRIPRTGHGELYFYCSEHGFMKTVL